MAVKPNTITTTTTPVTKGPTPMVDDPKTPGPTPISDDADQDTVPAPDPAPKKPAEGMYVVAGAPITPWGNGRKPKKTYGDKARMYEPGEVVSLTSALAKHYVKIGRLAPYIPDEDE